MDVVVVTKECVRVAIITRERERMRGQGFNSCRWCCEGALSQSLIRGGRWFDRLLDGEGAPGVVDGGGGYAINYIIWE